jgi:chaperonin cofactor prefoldin
MQEAESEVMLADEDVRYTTVLLVSLGRFIVGESFFYLASDSAQSYITEKTEELEKEIEGLKNEVANAKKTLAELKVKLYGKFGNAINLEE